MDSVFPMSIILVLLTVAVGAPIVQYFLSRRDLKAEMTRNTAEIKERITQYAESNERHTKLKSKVDYLYTVIQSQIHSLIKNQTNHKLDSLIDARREGTATLAELQELQKQLALRVEEADLKPAQFAAIALELEYILEYIEQGHEEVESRAGVSKRSPEDIREHQAKMETEQIAAGERKPHAVQKEKPGRTS